MLQQKTYDLSENTFQQLNSFHVAKQPIASEANQTNGKSFISDGETAFQMHPNDRGFEDVEWANPEMNFTQSVDNIQMTPEINAQSEPIVTNFTHSQAVVQRFSNPFYWCDALMRLIEYEEDHGRLNTLVEYNSFDNDDLIPLNYNIPSIYGEVDVDWMLRLAVIQYPFIIGSIFTPSMSEGFGGLASRAAYLALKTFWVAIDPRTSSWNWDSILEEGNWNSANVIVRWIHGQETLRDIFAPAIPLCQGQPSASPDTREPTY